MFGLQSLKLFVHLRLTAAAQEILGHVERTISEYEELHRADVQKLVESTERVPPEQQGRSPRLDRVELPKPPPIKEEQEEIHVKGEDDGEKPQSSELHQRPAQKMEAGADGEEDCGGPQPAKVPHSDSQSEPEDSSETETRVREETKAPWSSSTTDKYGGVSERDLKCDTVEKPFSCSVCGRGFGFSTNLRVHMRTHTGEKPFSCSVCDKKFSCRTHLTVHTRTHTGEKPFGCSVCAKTFRQKVQLTRHMVVHTGEKRFSCVLCGKRFTQKVQLTQHMAIHTGEKKYVCSVCDQRFTWSSQLGRHKCVRRLEAEASSSDQPMDTGPEGKESCRPEPASDSHLGTHSQHETEDHTEESSETEDSDDYCTETSKRP